MYEGVKVFLSNVLLDLTDDGRIKFEKLINSHDFIEYDQPMKLGWNKYLWNKYLCNICKYPLEDICWVNHNIWSPITCDEAKIKRALE